MAFRPNLEKTKYDIDLRKGANVTNEELIILISGLSNEKGMASTHSPLESLQSCPHAPPVCSLLISSSSCA